MSNPVHRWHWRCGNCGKEAASGMTHCPRCNALLTIHGIAISDDPDPVLPRKPVFTDDPSEQPAPAERVKKEPKQKKEGRKKWPLLLLLILLLLAMLAVALYFFAGQSDDPAPTEPSRPQWPPVATSPIDDTQPTVPPTTEPPTVPPTTVPPTTEPPTVPPTTVPPETQPPITEGPWTKNLLKADFKVSDYRYCSYIGYTFNRYYNAVHVVFVDNLMWLQDARSHYTGTVGNTKFKPAAWDVSEAQDGSVWAWFMTGHPSDCTSACQGKCQYVLYIGAEGGVNASLACAEMFAGCTDLQYIDFRGCFHTDGALSMEKMFYNCTSLRAVDVTSFNTHGVTNMSHMFYGINSTCKITIDLQTFDTSAVTEYEKFMYYGEQINGVPWTDLFP